jgi:hypothetical protein
MNVLVTLNPGLGAQLGPNFNLTADVGIVYPSTATLAELLAGIYVTVLNNAEIITITSVGECDNSIELNIVECTTTTTSTTSTTTSTTTTTTVQCSQFELIGLNGGGTWEALTCEGEQILGAIPALGTIWTGCIVTNSLVLNNANVVFEITCDQTTTTTSTTIAPRYDYCMGYNADNPYTACADYTNCLTTTTLAPHDILTGAFIVNNRVESLTPIFVDLAGYGTNATVNIDETRSFSVSGNIYTPNAAIFTITSSSGVDPLNVIFDSLTCTGVLDVQVVGGGTSSVDIIITPINYDGSFDVLSGSIRIIAS